MGAHFKLTPSHRAAIEDQIESLIAMLDGLDGDPDLELEEDVDAAHDDGCGPVYVHGALRWGSGYDGHGVALRYRVDQSAGPVNVEEQRRERYAAELGLVRSPGGGWRKPI